jgi:hypothetical protein
MEYLDILDYIQDHYDAFPNFDERTVQEVFACLPDEDARYSEGEAGLIALLNEIDFL